MVSPRGLDRESIPFGTTSRESSETASSASIGASRSTNGLVFLSRCARARDELGRGIAVTLLNIRCRLWSVVGVE